MPGRNSRCTFGQTPLTPTWEKSGKMTPPPEKFFQHADRHRRFLPSLLNVQNRAFWKPLSKIFLKLLCASINNHRSPMRILPASPPVSSCILPADLLCKNRGKVAPPPEIFFSTRIIIVISSPHCSMSKIELFGNLFRYFFSNCFARVSTAIDHPP